MLIFYQKHAYLTRFTREQVLEVVNQYCKDKYNFFYLPFDQKTKCNLGYGYINMLDLDSVARLYTEVGMTCSAMLSIQLLSLFLCNDSSSA